MLKGKKKKKDDPKTKKKDKSTRSKKEGSQKGMFSSTKNTHYDIRKQTT
jgi:hypothetical protein